MPRNISNGYFALRWEVLKRDAFTCQYCGRSAPDVKLEVDHVVPVSEGGEDTKENLVTACYSCNRGRSALSLRDRYITRARKVKVGKRGQFVEHFSRHNQILNLIGNKPLHTKEIMEALSMTRSNADVTLKQLKDGDWISKLEDGRWTLSQKCLQKLECLHIKENEWLKENT